MSCIYASAMAKQRLMQQEEQWHARKEAKTKDGCDNIHRLLHWLTATSKVLKAHVQACLTAHK